MTAVHRKLKNGRRGKDVAALQRAINTRLRARDIDYRVKVDGEYGPRTHKGALKALYFLGVTRASCFMPPNPRGLTKKAQKYIRTLISRTPGQIARSKRRIAAANRGPSEAVKWARSKVGIKESPAGSNKGPQISDWQEYWLGWAGYAWCGAFAGFALKVAGVKGLVGKNIVYTPSIVADARAGRNGFVKTVPLSEAKKGDLVLFDFDGGVVDHVGIFTGKRYEDSSIQTIEGNTSSDDAGSQSNGGGVFVRRRYPSVIDTVARPRWS